MDPPPIQYCRTADGVSLAYWTLGHGPTLLVAQGLTMSHVGLEWAVPSFRRFYQLLARDLRVVRWDQRGLGLSSGSLQTDLAQANMDLAALLAALPAQRVSILASGHGGIVYMPQVVHLGAAVSAYLAVSPGAQTRIDASATVHETVARLQPESEAEVTARRMDPDGLDPPGPLATLIENAMAPADRRRMSNLRLPGWDNDETMAALRVPTLVVHYPDEPMYQGGPEMAAAIEGARLVVRPGRGYPLYDPDPVGLADLIRDFVLEHAEPPSLAGADTGPADEALPLSPREREVLRLIAAGRTNAAIAADLVIAPGTVARHVSNMLAKTGCSNRVELATYAARHGLPID